MTARSPEPLSEELESRIELRARQIRLEVACVRADREYQFDPLLILRAFAREIQEPLLRTLAEGATHYEERLDKQADEIARHILATETLSEALRALRMDANRLCDRQLGGTYEADCRGAILNADLALAAYRRLTPGTEKT